MAKRRRVNVSKAIRTYFAEHPEATPKEASAAISAQIGKKVSSIYVSNVKALTKAKAKKEAPRGQKVEVQVVKGEPPHTFDLPTLESVMKLVRRVGKETAKRLMDLFDDEQHSK